jgi:hypothetical protein
MFVKEIDSTSVGVIEFETTHQMCSTMMRVQEYYESPEFKGKVFTHEEYQDWYAKTQGKFSYYEDWSGFNLPRICVEEVFVRFPDLWNKERVLCKEVIESNSQYIIACVKGDVASMVHEISHGLYYTDPLYQNDMDLLNEKFPKAIKKKIFAELRNAGYHEYVWEDELQAYMVDGINNTYDFNFTDKQQETVDRLIPRYQEILLDRSYRMDGILVEWRESLT